jgi:hypothetical protein
MNDGEIQCALSSPKSGHQIIKIRPFIEQQNYDYKNDSNQKLL